MTAQKWEDHNAAILRLDDTFNKVFGGGAVPSLGNQEAYEVWEEQ